MHPYNIEKDFEILVKNGWFEPENIQKYLGNPEIINAIKKSTSPKAENIFNALKLVPIKDVRAVILGKDPYPNPLHAHGLAFSSLNNVTPDSLKNVFKVLDKTYNSDLFQNAHNNLTPWAKQGVLLLNTSLTFEKNDDKKLQAKLQNIHAKIWKNFIKEIIDKILKSKNSIAVFLWGNDAHNLIYKSIKDKEFQKTIHFRTPQIIPNTDIMLLMASHPSPLSVNRGGDFLDVVPKHFLACDKHLKENKINWISLQGS